MEEEETKKCSHEECDMPASCEKCGGCGGHCKCESEEATTAPADAGEGAGNSGEGE